MKNEEVSTHILSEECYHRKLTVKRDTGKIKRYVLRKSQKVPPVHLKQKIYLRGKGDHGNWWLPKSHLAE